MWPYCWYKFRKYGMETIDKNWFKSAGHSLKETTLYYLQLHYLDFSSVIHLDSLRTSNFIFITLMLYHRKMVFMIIVVTGFFEERQKNCYYIVFP